jgi:hypothetical protein
MPIQMKDFEAFFAAKGIRGDCSFCGKNTWNLMTDANRNASLILLRPNDPANADAGFGAYGLACSNCGNVVLLSLDVLHEQADQLPQETLH